MMRSRRPLVAGLVLAAGMATGRETAPVAAQSVPLFPAGVLAVPVGGVAGIVVPPSVVVPPLGLGTRQAHVDQEQTHRRERGTVIIGGE